MIECFLTYKGHTVTLIQENESMSNSALIRHTRIINEKGFGFSQSSLYLHE